MGIGDYTGCGDPIAGDEPMACNRAMDSGEPWAPTSNAAAGEPVGSGDVSFGAPKQEQQHH